MRYTPIDTTYVKKVYITPVATTYMSFQCNLNSTTCTNATLLGTTVAARRYLTPPLPRHCMLQCLDKLLNPMGPGLFLPLKPRGGLFRPRWLWSLITSLDHGRNFNFWEMIALCMIFPTRYHTFLYLTWFGRRGGQMRFVGDFLALKVNATNARNRFIHYEPANFIK